MVNIIHDFIHEYDFLYDHILSPFKENLIDEFFDRRNKEGDHITDILLDGEIEEFKKIELGLSKIVEENYFVGNKFASGGIRAYVQNNQNSTQILHNHVNLKGSICAVFYLNIPKQGGEILFRDLENSEWGSEVTIKPKLNKVYLFPYWLPHVPLPQQDTTSRICFNWMYGSIQRPVHKFYLTQW